MAVFKKKGKKKKGKKMKKAGKDIAKKILKLREDGMANKEIVEKLRKKGMNNQQILDAMKKADIKSGAGKKIEPMFKKEDTGGDYPAMATAGAKAKGSGLSTAEVEELVEKTVEEKLKGTKKELDKLKKWKEETASTHGEMKTKVDKISNDIDLFKKQISERVSGYSEGIKEVNTNVQAMNKVFKDVLPELTGDVKELSGIVDKLKEK